MQHRSFDEFLITAKALNAGREYLTTLIDGILCEDFPYIDEVSAWNIISEEAKTDFFTLDGEYFHFLKAGIAKELVTTVALHNAFAFYLTIQLEIAERKKNSGDNITEAETDDLMHAEKIMTWLKEHIEHAKHACQQTGANPHLDAPTTKYCLENIEAIDPDLPDHTLQLYRRIALGCICEEALTLFEINLQGIQYNLALRAFCPTGEFKKGDIEKLFTGSVSNNEFCQTMNLIVVRYAEIAQQYTPKKSPETAQQWHFNN